MWFNCLFQSISYWFSKWCKKIKFNLYYYYWLSFFPVLKHEMTWINFYENSHFYFVHPFRNFRKLSKHLQRHTNILDYRKILCSIKNYFQNILKNSLIHLKVSQYYCFVHKSILLSSVWINFNLLLLFTLHGCSLYTYPCERPWLEYVKLLNVLAHESLCQDHQK